jgi:cytochrome c oxidase subunit 4
MSAQHIVSRKVYFTIFATLMAFTIITVLVASLDLGALSVVVALAIACTKAVLVVLYFMHVRYGTRLTQIVVAAGLVWFLTLIGLTFSDYLSRGWLPVPRGW